MKLFAGLIAEDQDSKRRVEWMLLGWAVCGLVLFVVTKDLWLGRTDFPQVPLFGIGHFVPHWVDAIGYILVITCLVWTIATSRILSVAKARNPTPSTRMPTGFRWPLALFADALVILVICNQHRLQPWAYLAWLTAIVVFFCKPKQAIVLLRVLVIGIYLHSAITKFDHEFVTTLGLSFLRPIKEQVGLRMNWGTSDHFLAGLFPLSELLVAAGLFFRRTRRLAVLVAVCMHVALTFLLWRVLQHELPVLVWNVYFVWQVVVLFGGRSQRALRSDAVGPDAVSPDTASLDTVHAETANTNSITSDLHAAGWPIAVFVIGAATCLPFLEPLGLFDHWPAWGLYAPRNSRCELFVKETEIERLPVAWRDGAREYVDAEHGWTPGMEIGLAWKSLHKLKVPIYPQDRFQLGVALAIVRKYELGDAATVVVESASDRISGKRDRRTYTGLDEIETAAERYWLNVEPRTDSWGE